MLDFESFCERFKFGDIEDIFIVTYSYLIIGYLILFVTYGQKFILLELHDKILLSIAISYPLTSLTTIFWKLPSKNMENKKTEKEGLFSKNIVVIFVSSVAYSIGFSLFFISNHARGIEYDDVSNSVNAINLIVFIFGSILIYSHVFPYVLFVGKFIKKRLARK